VGIGRRDASRPIRIQLSNPPPTLISTTTTMNSLVQRFDTNSVISEIKRAKAIIEEDGDDVSASMWGSCGGFGNLATGVPKFNIPAVPDVSSSRCARWSVHVD
jgi:20S proteasome subunit beta 5